MKKYLILVSVLFLLFSLWFISDTYALFETNASATSNLEIGKWSIILNETDISLAETITLDNFTYSANTHTEDGYFAPGRNGEFEIDIDTSLSDVSVEYSLEIDDSELEEHPNIEFQIVDLDTNQTISSNTASGVILLSDQNRVKRIKIVLVWSDITEFDEEDTSLIGTDMQFNISANFRQYLGE